MTPRIPATSTEHRLNWRRRLGIIHSPVTTDNRPTCLPLPINLGRTTRSPGSDSVWLSVSCDLTPSPVTLFLLHHRTLAAPSPCICSPALLLLCPLCLLITEIYHSSRHTLCGHLATAFSSIFRASSTLGDHKIPFSDGSSVTVGSFPTACLHHGDQWPFCPHWQ